MRGVAETRYVEVGDADVAYRVMGDGPLDLVYCYGIGSHVEVWQEVPAADEFFRRLASFSRLIFFDRRGVGASDGVPRNAIPTWEESAEDLGAVLDAVGSSQAAIFVSLDAGPAAVLFAATHPERVSALILLNTTARFLVADDYPFGASSEEVDALVDVLRTSWGTLELARLTNPSVGDDAEYLAAVAKIVRCAVTPRSAAAQYDYILRSLDVRDALGLIQAPTLVMAVRESPLIPMEHGRYLAAHIPGARFVELAGGDIGITPSMLPVADEVAEFLTGERLGVDVDRILTTVMFSDIAESTKRLAAAGDARWRAILDTHDKSVREELRRFRGNEIKTTGDGFVASFDGPARAIRCAQSIIAAVTTLGLEVRIGLHTGECTLRGDDLGGLAVHIAARVGALANAGQVLVSRTVKDLVVGSGIGFSERGEYELKGVPGNWTLFTVDDVPSA
jgi:class 3 adenylate cyclase